MESHSLLNLSALDGRYRDKVAALAPITSEFGLLRYRVQVECHWFTHLAQCTQIAQLPVLSKDIVAQIHEIGEAFTVADAEWIKATEATTNHDVKAVEYFVKKRIANITGLAEHIEFVHFACTSEDINNLAYALMLNAARDTMLDQIETLVSEIEQFAVASADLAMLSRTHGQPASPTTVGKELANVVARLRRQQTQLGRVEIMGKMNGAVGNFNAHVAAYPEVNWMVESANFVTSLGLSVNPLTTQIEPHDYMAEYFHVLMRFNQVLLDFDRDVWGYISINYFGQRKVDGETGSSTMPHKVNPIDFENSEGNLGVANALLEHMASKLPVSRWQRDLSDSTVLRNIGSALGHCLVAYQATRKGMGRLEINQPTIAADLDSSWEVLGEAVQTVMRKYGLPEPYEQLKQATRGKQLDAELFHQVLKGLDIPADAKSALLSLEPSSYTGLASTLARTATQTKSD